MAALIGRPAHKGHVGEFIASEVFNIALEPSATAKGIDGRFQDGVLAGRSVNVKFYPQNGGLLDINPSGVPDYYLVLAGPWTPAVSSRGATAPWLISHVFLFAGPALLERLHERNVKLGAATSVIRALWDEAEIYPSDKNHEFQLSPLQREVLGYFPAPAEA